MILKMQWAYETRKTTKADFLREISNMRGVPELIAEFTGASTKDFSCPDSEIVQVPLKSKQPSATASDSSYETSSGGSNSIGAHGGNTIQTSAPKPSLGGPRMNVTFSRQQRWVLISYCGAS